MGDDVETAVLTLIDKEHADPEIVRSIAIRGAVRLGRVKHADYADVAISSKKFSAMVSRKHATVKFSSGKWTIEDNKSVNGVMVNRKAIPPGQPHVLNENDHVTFGTEESDLVYSFELGKRQYLPAQQRYRQELKNLDELRQKGLMEPDEYEQKRQKLQNANNFQLAFDKTPQRTSDIVSGKGMGEREVAAAETAAKYTFDFENKVWVKTWILVHIEPKSFSAGAMRACHQMTDFTKPHGQNRYVAKIAKDTNERQYTYFADVEMQALCQYVARQYNQFDPPKRVEFVEASVIEIIGRPGKPIYATEPFMQGKYKKYNNNWGFVSAENRNTPQAFSHYSHVATNGLLLICDIQGVEDFFTDPQVHSADHKGFGKGNMGQEGINQFFATHECNMLCEVLGIANGQRRKKNDFNTRPPVARQKKVTHDSAFEAQFELTDKELRHYMLEREQAMELVKKFKEADMEGQGAITHQQLLVLCKALGLAVEEKRRCELLRMVDRDRTGKISFREFLDWWCGLGE